MNHQAARVVLYEEIIELLSSMGVSGRACEFGTTSNEVIKNALSFTEFKLLPFPEYDICNLNNLDSNWDFILADQVLEHVRQPWIAVEEVRKHLRPGGVAVFTTPFLYRLHPDPQDYWRFTPEGMKVLCASYAEVVTGQWGNEAIVSASFRRDPLPEELEDRSNDSLLPIVVWTVARNEGGYTPTVGASPSTTDSDASEGGPWQVDDFIEFGGDSWVEPLVCDYITSSFQIKDAIDLGCGAGRFVQYLNKKGVDTWGVEPVDLHLFFTPPDKFIQQDLRFPIDFEHKYDLVLCLEVAEHIDATYESQLFINICNHSGRYLLFSAATPGQGGHGHVNEHTEEYWFRRLEQQGFRLLVVETNICRALCKYPWYAKNMSFWKIGDEVQGNNQEVPTLLLSDRPSTYIRNLEDLYTYQQNQSVELHNAKNWLSEQQINLLQELERRSIVEQDRKDWIDKLEQSQEQLYLRLEVVSEQSRQLLDEKSQWIRELEQGQIWLKEQIVNYQHENARLVSQMEERLSWINEIESGRDWLAAQQIAYQEQQTVWQQERSQLISQQAELLAQLTESASLQTNLQHIHEQSKGEYTEQVQKLQVQNEVYQQSNIGLMRDITRLRLQLVQRRELDVILVEVWHAIHQQLSVDGSDIVSHNE